MDCAKDSVRTNAGRFSNAVALENAETGERLTWRQLDARVAALAGHLRQRCGVGTGDRVLLLAEGDTRTFEVQFACMRLGAILVPLNWRLALPELIELATDVEPAVVIVDGVWQDAGLKIGEAAGTHIASAGAAQQGSTTTRPPSRRPRPCSRAPACRWSCPRTSCIRRAPPGGPRARSPRSRRSAGRRSTSSSECLLGPGAKQLNPMPLFHAGGLTTIATPMLMTGGAVMTMRRFEPDRIVALLGDPAQGITHFTAPPVMWAALAAQPGFARADFGALRFAQVAGGVPARELLAPVARTGCRAAAGLRRHRARARRHRHVPAAVAQRPASCGARSRSPMSGW